MSFIDDLRELADRLEKYEKKDLEREVEKTVSRLIELKDEAIGVYSLARQAINKASEVKSVADAEAFNEWLSEAIPELNDKLKYIEVRCCARK